MPTPRLLELPQRRRWFRGQPSKACDVPQATKAGYACRSEPSFFVGARIVLRNRLEEPIVDRKFSFEPARLALRGMIIRGLSRHQSRDLRVTTADDDLFTRLDFGDEFREIGLRCVDGHLRHSSDLAKWIS